MWRERVVKDVDRDGEELEEAMVWSDGRCREVSSCALTWFSKRSYGVTILLDRHVISFSLRNMLQHLSLAYQSTSVKQQIAWDLCNCDSLDFADVNTLKDEEKGEGTMTESAGW